MWLCVMHIQYYNVTEAGSVNVCMHAVWYTNYLHVYMSGISPHGAGGGISPTLFGLYVNVHVCMHAYYRNCLLSVEIHVCAA